MAEWTNNGLKLYSLCNSVSVISSLLAALDKMSHDCVCVCVYMYIGGTLKALNPSDKDTLQAKWFAVDEVKSGLDLR